MIFRLAKIVVFKEWPSTVSQLNVGKGFNFPYVELDLNFYKNGAIYAKYHQDFSMR